MTAQQKAKRTPAVARRRAAEFFLDANATCDQVQQEGKEKSDKLAKLQGAPRHREDALGVDGSERGHVGGGACRRGSRRGGEGHAACPSARSRGGVRRYPEGKAVLPSASWSKLLELLAARIPAQPDVDKGGLSACYCSRR